MMTPGGYQSIRLDMTAIGSRVGKRSLRMLAKNSWAQLGTVDRPTQAK